MTTTLQYPSTEIGLPALQELAYSRAESEPDDHLLDFPQVVEPTAWRYILHQATRLLVMGLLIAMAVLAWGVVTPSTTTTVASAPPVATSVVPVPSEVSPMMPYDSPPPPAMGPDAQHQVPPVVNVVGSSCRLGSTPTVDADGVTVYCSRIQYTDGYVWSRIPVMVPQPLPVPPRG